MRMDKQDESRNVEDRRGESGGFRFPGGGGGPMASGGRGGFGLVTTLVLFGLALLFGFDPRAILGGGGLQLPGGAPAPQVDAGGPRTSAGGGRVLPPGQATDDLRTFMSRVLKSTEDVWGPQFRSFGKTYSEPKLVLFDGHFPTACGEGMAAMGPFYCPNDQKVYLDMTFFNDLKTRFGAPGDFAQAYVIGHEVGHHVQTLLGIADKVQQLKSRMGQREQNALQVRMELQADCLAGVWAHQAHRAKQILEPGDIEEALRAATAIGDDNIQRQTQGRVVPDAFTHGSAEQRVRWFRRGLETGDMQGCDTFNAREL
jgi:uncharacterized protein